MRLGPIWTGCVAHLRGLSSLTEAIAEPIERNADSTRTNIPPLAKEDDAKWVWGVFHIQSRASPQSDAAA